MEIFCSGQTVPVACKRISIYRQKREVVKGSFKQKMQSTEDLTITHPEDVAGGCGWLFIRCSTLVCAGVWLSRASAPYMPSTNLMCEVDPWPSVFHSMQVLQGGVVRVWWDIQPEETHWPSGQRGCFQVWSHTCHLQKMRHGGRLEQYYDNNTEKKKKHCCFSLVMRLAD